MRTTIKVAASAGNKKKLMVGGIAQRARIRETKKCGGTERLCAVLARLRIDQKQTAATPWVTAAKARRR
jgi:hypothetical protein